MVAIEKGQDIPPGSTPPLPTREKTLRCEEKGTSIAALRTLVKTYCSGRNRRKNTALLLEE